MSKIRDILISEQSNRSHIYLYRRGLFYQAFEYSAYLFSHLISPIAVTAHHQPRSKWYYCMLNIPLQQLSNYPIMIDQKPIDEALLCYTPSEFAIASLSESYDEWHKRITSTGGRDSSLATPSTVASQTPLPVVPIASQSSELVVPSPLNEQLEQAKLVAEPETLGGSVHHFACDLKLEDKVWLCDWMIYRILMVSTRHICPMDALKWLDKLQEELRDKLWHD